MRLFVALNPPPAARRDWASAVEPLRARDWPLRWVDVAALHVTLQFLGNVGAERVAAIETALHAAAAAHVPFDMHVRGLGAFPDARRPRVLWLGVEPDPPLLALQRDVGGELARLGLEAETRGWSPHVTLARARGGVRLDDVEDAVRSFRYDGVVPVRAVDLMKSTLTRSGARYECIASAELGQR